MGSITLEQPLSVQFAEKLATYGIATASDADIGLIVQAFIDTVGCILIGRVEKSVQIVSKTFGLSPGPCSIIGSGSQTASALDATMINGVASHAVDYDDMVDGSHPSTTIVPAVLALGQELGASGAELVDAYIAGFETHQRFLRVLFPHHYNNGWHPTGTIGTFASAAACARLLKLDITQTAMALSLAASMASGIKANFGTMTKPFHSGQCGRNGLLAALLVRDGFNANLSALEHKAGFFQAYDGLENIHNDRLLSGWSQQVAISRGPWALKPYPCCGSTHMAIRAAFKLRKDYSDILDLAQIQSIKITVHRERIPHTNNPYPQSPLQSKFSIQYATARALVSGVVRLAHFEGMAYAEDAIQRLLPLITVEPRQPSDRRDIGEICAGAVQVTLKNGKDLLAEVPGVLGPGSAEPFTEDELWEKFSDCASRTFDQDKSRRVFDFFLALPEQSNLDRLVKIMA